MSETAIEAALGHDFARRDLLDEALTHRSWTHERGGAHNERLEFLGDSILGACTTHLLVEAFPAATEGDLSRLRASLVKTGTLAEIAKEIGLGDALKLGRGEVATGGRERTSVLADGCEALLGALYLDAGFSRCLEAVRTWMGPRIAALARDGVGETWKDPRNRLQELTQERFGVTPTYAYAPAEGPSHAPTFTVDVKLGERVLASGSGGSKREAAQKAAARAYEDLCCEGADGVPDDVLLVDDVPGDGLPADDVPKDGSP